MAARGSIAAAEQPPQRAARPPPPHPLKLQLQLEQLEPRLLLSADGLGLAPELALPGEQPIYAAITAPSQSAEPAPAAIVSSRELVFIDPRVPDAKELLAGLVGDADPSRKFEIIVLDTQRDGIVQVTAALKSRMQLDAVHFITHGSDGAVQVGGTLLDAKTLAANKSLISAWGSALKDDADLLFYGCDLAATARGRALVDWIADLTGADVAASTDPTGNALQGGDWVLEYRKGAVETEIAVSATAQASWAGALATAAGGETLVNSTVAPNQDAAGVARDAAGNYVVVWASDNQDGDKNGVYARRFAANGTPIGAEFQVNTYITNDQMAPVVAMDLAGNFVVVWQSDGQDGDNEGIYARRYNAAGTALDVVEFRVNTVWAQEQQSPTVAMDADGDFIVAWQSKDQAGASSNFDIFARRYNAAGVAQDAVEFQVNQSVGFLDKEQQDPAVAMDDAGNFVVAWQSKDQDGDNWGVYARLYDAAGFPGSGEILVNTETNKEQQSPAVAMDADGDFVVAWQSMDQDTNKWGIYAQRFNALGAKQGLEFRVNTTFNDDQQDPAVAMSAAGAFTIAWASQNQDGGSWGVYKRDYAADGTPEASGETRVNTTTANAQEKPAIAMNGAGLAHYVIVWSGNGGVADGQGVFAQRFLAPIPPAAISGTVFHDVDGDADVSLADGTLTFAGALVQLYRDVDTTINGNEVLVGTTNTDGAGRYSFSGLAADTYYVVVDSTSLNSGVSYNTVPIAYDASYIWAEQTYGVTGAAQAGGFLTGSGALYGGRRANTSDNTGNISTAEHVTQVVVAGVDVTDINSGFSFNAVTTERDGDDATGNRTIQGSLRQFLINANAITNASFGIQSSNFSIGGGGARTITMASAPPPVTEGVVLDARTQEGFASIPLIQLNGASAGPNSDGLVFLAGTSEVRGFVINNWGVGGGSGNGGTGIIADGTSKVTIAGNYIGTNAAGSGAVTNGDWGILLKSSGNTVGGINAGDRNVISGNTLDGINVVGSSDNRIIGNFIGTNATGTAALANGTIGVRLQAGSNNNVIGGTSASERNVIAGNLEDGIKVDGSSGNRIQGNYLGTNAAGTAAVANRGAGVWLINATSNTVGGTAAGEGNVVSGNGSGGTWQGVLLQNADNNFVQGNYIGLDKNGSATAGLGNAGAGVEINSGSDGNLITNNVIGRNGQDGVVIAGSASNAIRANMIGTDAGGAVLAGNGNYGIWMTAGAVNNIIGGAGAADGNAIAGNQWGGIEIDGNSSTGNAILGNRIYSNNSVSGTTGTGIDLNATGGAGLGDGVTLNDAAPDNDNGPNRRQNFPVLATPVTNLAQVQISGSLASAINTTYRIEVFASTASDPTGYGEGERFLGWFNVTTDGTGNISFNRILNAVVNPGESVSATATVDLGGGNFGDTSEFSRTAAAALGTRTISGTLHHDVDGDADVTDAPDVFVGARVSLYLDNGDGVIGAGDTYVTSVVTDATGKYTFGGLFDANYYVVVDSKTLTPDPGVWAEQTYATKGAANNATGTSFTVGDGALYGGRTPGVSDDVSNLSTAQHVTKVSTAGANATAIDFGFSFNVVTNVRGDQADDDDGGAITERHSQGTLDQFILNANAIPGSNEMRFVPAVAANAGFGTWWQINVTGAALPTITGDKTSIDGTAYAAAVNGLALDTNTGLLGTGGNVGVDVLTLGQVARPELEIVDGGGFARGLDIAGNDAAVSHLAIYGFGTTTLSGDIAVGNVTGTFIDGAVIGLTAAGADPGAAARSQRQGILVEYGDNGTVRNSLIGNTGYAGIELREATGWQIDDNEIRGAGWSDDGWDAINMLYNSSAVILGNLLESNVGPGIDVVLGSGNVLIENNTIRGNASVTEQYGIDFEDATGSNVVWRNMISGNTGAGVLVTGTTASVRITENVIYANTGVGIDLSGTSVIGDGVTANDPGDIDSGPNSFQNFPVLTGAATNGTTVTIAGSLESTAGTVYRMEFFADGVGGPRFLGALSPDLLVGASGSATFSASLSGSVAVGETITATATNLTTNATSEFSAAVIAGGMGSISGTIFHDVDGNANVADDGPGAVFANALNAVALYLDDGDGIIDSGDSFVAAVSTDALGGYLFGGLAPGDYYVVVNSQRLDPNPALWAEQTYAVTGAATGNTFTILDGALYGGRERLGPGSGTSDNAAGSITTAEHVTRVTLAGGNATGIDSGFSFTAITNNRGDAIDDDTSNARLQQGTLRQFILNANALAGPQTANFSINYAGGGGAQTINITNAELPMITGTVVLDAAATQEGSSGAPVIELNGAAVGGAAGLTLSSSDSLVRGFAINRFDEGILLLGGGGNTITGNYLGTDLTGTIDRGNQYGLKIQASNSNKIGVAAGGNLISGNDIDGIWVRNSSGTLIRGNFIGTDATGTFAIANNEDGIWLDGGTGNVVGGTFAGDRNVISGNGWAGVAMSGGGSSHVVQGNWIGLDATGASLGNLQNGVRVYDGTGALIGGTAASAGNVIANNGAALAGAGVAIDSGSGHSVLGNSIYANSGLGIDVGFDGGVTLNDSPDADGLQNFPVLTTATTNAGTITISGTLQSTPGSSFRIEFFATPAPGDASGYGEGERYLGSMTVLSDGAGDATFTSPAFTATVAVGERITATATDLTFGDTSEFSSQIAAALPNTAPLGDDVSANGNEDDLSIAIVLTGSDAEGPLASFRITSALPANGLLYEDAGLTTLAIVGTKDYAATGNALTLYFVPDADWSGVTTFQFTATDGDGANAATPASATIDVAAVNDAPQVTIASGSVPYTENDPATPVDPSLTVTDVDTATLVSATVQINGGYVNGEDVLSFTPVGAISGVWDAPSGTLTLTAGGATTMAEWQAVLQSVAYQNTSEDPTAGPRTIELIVSDGTASSALATRTVDVAAVNDAPVANDVVANGNEDDASIAITLTGTDVDDSIGSFRLASLPANGLLYEDAGLTTLAIAGTTDYTATGNARTLYFKPDANWNGSSSFQFVAVDTGGLESVAPATATINVAPVDDLPVATDDTYSATEDTPLIVTAGTGVLANDAGLGDGGLTLSVVGPVTGGAVVLNNDGSFTFTPTADFNGAASFNYQVQDADGDIDTAVVTINVAPADDLPLATDDTYGTMEDTPLVVPAGAGVLANDSNLGDGPLTLSVVGPVTGGSVALNNDGSFTFTPATDFNGAASFTYQVQDADGDVDTAVVTINVAPTDDLPLATDDIYAATEDVVLNVPALTGVVANDTGLGDGGLTMSVVGPVTGGAVALSSDGSFSFTPTADFNGTASFTYQVQDADGDTSTALVTINVAPADDSPVAVNDTYAAAEDTPLVVLAGTGVLANDTGLGDGGLTLSVVGPVTGGAVVLNNDGSFSFTPTADFNGAASFTYQVQDADGDVSVALVTINVTPANDVPVATDDTYAAAEDTVLNVPALTGVLANDSGLGDGPLTLSVVGPVTGGAVALSNDGSFTFTPTADFSGAASFTYQVQDIDGDTATATVTINVAPADDVPVTVADTYAATEDVVLNVPALTGVLANDTGLGDGGLTLSVVGPVIGGGLALNNDGSFTFTPTVDFNGAASFTYQVQDADGDVSSALVTIGIAPVADAPTGTTNTITVSEDTSRAFAAVDFGFADVDGEAFAAVRIDAISLPAGATLQLGGVDVNPGDVIAVGLLTTLVFTPAPDANGAGYAAFDFSVQDSGGAFAIVSSTITIDVAPANDVPLATGDAVATNQETPVTTGDVLANDALGDQPTTILTFDAVSAQGGTVTLGAGNAFTYTPTAAFSGTDTFTYTIQDLDGETSTATVTVTVANVANDPPVNVVPGLQITAEDVPLVFSTASGNRIAVTDPDAGAMPLEVTLTAVQGALTLAGTTGLTFTVGTGAGDATMTFTGTMTDINAALDGISFVPTLDYSGPASVTITTGDLGSTGAGGPQSDSDTVNINVTVVDDSPVLDLNDALPATGVDYSQTFTEGLGSVPITDVDATLRDADSANLASLTVTITNLLDGTDEVLTADTTGTLITATYLPGSGVLTLNGADTVANYEQVLRTVRYENLSEAPNSAQRVITFVASDGGSFSNVGTTRVTVNAVNDSPTAAIAAPSYAAIENAAPLVLHGTGMSVADIDALSTSIVDVYLSSISGILSATAGTTGVVVAGSGSPNLTFTGTVAQINALLAGGGGATITYVVGSDSPAPTDTLSLAINDRGATGSGGALWGWDSVTVDLTAVNDAPLITIPGAASTPEDTPLVFLAGSPNEISITDVDAGASPVLVTLGVNTGTLTLNAAATAGLATLVGDGTGSITMTGTVANINLALDGLAFAPNADYNGPVFLSLSVDDQGWSGTGGALTDADSMTITVTPVNDAPAGSDNSVSTPENTAYAFVVADFGFTDGDVGDSLSGVRIDSVTLPVGATLQLLGVDILPGDVIATADIVAGNLVFTPTPGSGGIGYATFTFSVRDTGGAFDSTPNAMTIDVTNAPVNTIPGAQTVDVDTDLPIAGLSVVDPDFDLDTVALAVGNGTVTVTLAGSAAISGGANGSTTLTLTGTETDINATLATLVYRGGPGYAGPDTLTVTSSDLLGQKDIDTIAITVSQVNNPPTATIAAAGYAATEQVPLVLTGDLWVDDTDAGAAVVTVRISAVTGNLMVNAGGTGAIVAGSGSPVATLTGTILQVQDVLLGNAGASVQYVMSSDLPPATDTLTLWINDNHATDPQTASTAAAITITTVNDAPVNTLPGGATTLEDTPLVYSATGGNQISITDVDAAGASLQVTLNASNGVITLGGIGGVSFLSGDGLSDSYMQFTGTVASINAALNGLIFAPNLNYNGLAFITMTTSDGALSDIDLATIDVLPVNDAPDGTDTTVTAIEDTPYTFTLSRFGFNDVDSGEGDFMTEVRIDSITLPAGATLQLNGVDVTPGQVITRTEINNGWLVFTPVADANGANYASFTFSVADFGVPPGSLFDPVPNRMTIDVAPVNDLPIITSDGGLASAAFVIAENTTAVTTVTATDVDLQPLTYSLFGADAGRFTIGATTGVLAFSPAPNFEAPTDAGANNIYNVNVIVSDGFGGSDTQALTITVTDVDDAPFALADSYTTNEDTVLSVAAPGALANDYDEDGSPISATLVTGPSNGSLAFNTDGSFVYTPNANFFGTDSFVYRVSDGALQSGNATVTLTVNGVQDAPTSANGNVNTDEGVTYAFTLANFNYSDADGDPFDHIEITSLPSVGTLLLSGTAVAVNNVVSAADIAAGNLNYAPPASVAGPVAETFGFRVHDGTQYQVGGQIMTVGVAPLPVVAPPPPTGGGGTPPPPSTGGSGGSGSGSTDDTGSGSTGGEEAPPAGGGRSGSGGGESAAPAPEAPAQEIAKVESADSGATNSAPSVADASMTVRASGVEVARDGSGLGTPAVSDATKHEKEISEAAVAALSAPEFQDDLNKLREQNAEEATGETRVAGTVFAASTSLSVGYVIWLLRGGVLLSSLLSSLPAWRLVDPLPVLSRLSDGSDDEDDASLEELVTHEGDDEYDDDVADDVDAEDHAGHAAARDR